MHNRILLFVFFSLLGLTANGQTFGAGLVLGVNASQIQGDELAGYSKLGIHGGVRGIIRLSERTQLSTAILYSQRGSRAELFAGSLEAVRKINLDYIEVPLLFYYLDWLHEEDDYYRVHFHGGLAYGRLLSASAENSSYEEIANRELFVENNINYTFGATYMINANWGATIRYARSFNRAFDRRDYEDDPSIPEVNSLIPFWLTFRLEYLF